MQKEKAPRRDLEPQACDLSAISARPFTVFAYSITELARTIRSFGEVMPANAAILRTSVRSTLILYRRLSHPRRSAASGAARSRRLGADGKKTRPPARG